MSTVSAARLEEIVNMVRASKEKMEETVGGKSAKSMSADKPTKGKVGRPSKGEAREPRGGDPNVRAKVRIEKLASQVPVLEGELSNLPVTFSNLEASQLLAVKACLDFELKKRSALEAAQVRTNKDAPKLELGDKVQINHCLNRKFIGKIGTVVLVRRVRAFVEVPGHKAQAYVFVSDVSKVGSGAEQVEESFDQTAEETATGTGG